MEGNNSLQVVQHRNEGVMFCNSGVKLEFFSQERNFGSVEFHCRGFFASVNQVGKSFGISPYPPLENVSKASSKQMKLLSLTEAVSFDYKTAPESVLGDVLNLEEKEFGATKKKPEFKWRIKIRNHSLRKLISGGFAGAVSRTAVAPLETIRTHLMVGSCGNSSMEVFNNIMKNEGWQGLFRGNLVNVIRVAPSKAIELFAYDTVLRYLSPENGEKPKLPIPASSIAGAVAGVSATLCTYPLELVKTRLTIQRGVYRNLVDAFVKISREEGAGELFRGLTPSLIGVIPYAAANYFAYDTLGKAYKKAFKKDRIGNVMTLLIGSAAGAISGTATFPLEIARKQMQAGALSRQQYRNMLHALVSILETDGMAGLFKGVGASCMKLVPAAGIAFMCYEASKRVLVVDEEDS